jgi:hypothetical protein
LEHIYFHLNIWKINLSWYLFIAYIYWRLLTICILYRVQTKHFHLYFDNVYCTGIGDLNPCTNYEGCQPDFNTGINSLAVCYCDAQPTGTSIRHVTWMIDVKYYMHSKIFQIKVAYYYDIVFCCMYYFFLCTISCFKKIWLFNLSFMKSNGIAEPKWNFSNNT